MGKHSGPQDLDDTAGPCGPGPHPTPEESERAGREFERDWEQSQKRAGEEVNNCTNPPHYPPHCGCPIG